MWVLQSKYYSDTKIRTRNYNKEIIEQNPVISINEKVINKIEFNNKIWIQRPSKREFTVIKVASFQKFRDGSSVNSRIHMITSIDIGKV